MEVNFEIFFGFCKTRPLHESIKKDFSSLASLGAEELELQSDSQTARQSETGDYKRTPTLWVTLKIS
jgi:hypothetical protein